MRVLVATDSIASHSSAEAGRLLATGWPEGDATVLPLGEAGHEFVRSAADQLGVELQAGVQTDHLVSTAGDGRISVVAVERTSRPDQGPIDYQASTAVLGHAVAEHLRRCGETQRLVVDLTGQGAHDGGAGFLAALGASADVSLTKGVAGLAGISRLDLGPVRDRLAGVDLVGVVGSAEARSALLGLRGITSRHSRDPQADRARLLATDANLAALAQLAAPDQADSPGAGAAGGLGFAVLALGGRLTTGPRYGFEAVSDPAALEALDLVVTGCTVVDFAHRGGGVVAEAARVGVEKLCPVIAIAGEVLIGARELRTLGIESAYPVRQPTPDASGSGDVTREELISTARRIARSWRW